MKCGPHAAVEFVAVGLLPRYYLVILLLISYKFEHCSMPRSGLYESISAKTKLILFLQCCSTQYYESFIQRLDKILINIRKRLSSRFILAVPKPELEKKDS